MTHIEHEKRERAWHEIKRGTRAMDEGVYHLRRAAECLHGTDTATALELVAESIESARNLIDTSETEAA